MSEKILTFIDLITYALAAISGGLGGCASAAYLQSRLISQKEIRAAFFVAYGIIGVAIGILVAGLAFVFFEQATIHKVITSSLLAGIVSPVILAVVHSYTRWRLEKHGKRYTFTIEPLDSGDGT